MSCFSSDAPPSVSVVLGRVLRDVLTGQGMPVAEFQRRSGLSAHELAQDGLRLGLDRHERLRTLLPLIDPAEIDRAPIDRDGLARYWPDLAALWFNEPDAARAVREWVMFRPLIGSIDAVALHERPDQLVVTYRPVCAGAAARQSVMANFAMLRELLREHQTAAGTGALRLQAEIADIGLSRHRLVAQHQLQMPVRCSGQADVHRLIVRGPALRVAAAPSNPWLAERSRAHLSARLRQLLTQPVCDDLAARVEQVLAARWDAPDGMGLAESGPSADPDADDAAALQRAVAQALGLSRWTLRRQLEASGLSFADVVERLRGRRLQALLPRTDLSLLDVAWRTGFRSASAFSRYHRRRYGQAPSQRRRSLVGA